MNFPLGDKELRIGILGMTEGNGHPYSWSAMFNGYDPEEMETCGFPVIPRYLTSGDSYYAFKKQLDLFVHWLRTGEEPFPFAESVELMKLVIGGLRSREEGGREVFLSEINVD